MTYTNDEQPVRNPVRVLVFGASLRSGSLNQCLASAAAEAVEREGGIADLEEMSAFDAPSYDGDLESELGIPPGAEEFGRRLAEADGFVIASPEYNGSMPGPLKNLIDWGSRFDPQPFAGKHGLLLSASPSPYGGHLGLWSLRVPFEVLGVRLHPEMFSVPKGQEALDEEGRLDDPGQGQRLQDMVRSFLDGMEADRHYVPEAKARPASMPS